MAKRATYYPEAEHLFVAERLTLESISKKLGVSTRTLQEWAKQGNWEQRREAFAKMAISSHEKTHRLYNRWLDRAVNADELDIETVYALSKLAPLLKRLEQYEDAVAKKDNTAPKGLSDDVVALIEESVLGLKRKEEQGGDAKE
jgi:DNA-binding transcriptional MerR regulator